MRIVIVGGRAQQKYFGYKLRDQKNVEIWGLNAIRPRWVPYWSRMFNLHTYERLIREDWPVEVEQDWATENPDVPFYVLDKWPKLASQRIFPGKRLMRDFPRGDYHCGSFDWMVAFACTMPKVTEIALHGIGLERAVEGGEPISSRACLEYWCGYAAGHNGIEITCAKDTDLFMFFHVVKSRLIYSYDHTPLVEDRT